MFANSYFEIINSKPQSTELQLQFSEEPSNMNTTVNTGTRVVIPASEVIYQDETSFSQDGVILSDYEVARMLQENEYQAQAQTELPKSTRKTPQNVDINNTNFQEQQQRELAFYHSQQQYQSEQSQAANKVADKDSSPSCILS